MSTELITAEELVAGDVIQEWKPLGKPARVLKVTRRFDRIHVTVDGIPSRGSFTPDRGVVVTHD